jgi:uncharacterized protein YcbX
MYVAELWRYPVKSMAGEKLGLAELGEAGIAGDRVVQVRSGEGRVVTSRTRPRLLGHRATLGPDGLPVVDGRPWASLEVARDVEAAVATDGAIAAFGYDGRRLRPNIVIGGVEGLAERTWEGKFLRAGEVIIGIEDLRGRCVMTTFDPDTQEQDVGVLQRIQQEFGGTMALNCYVVRGGTLRIGDPVEILETADGRR